MNFYFAYIRVSTVKQGERGSSLHEQRDAIKSFSGRNGLTITEWFEERETAAKVGRREFTRMLAALKRGNASGVIFHKIDRSARNLKDWSTIQDLAEQGIDVRFTQESVNLSSNEGRLTGDFLAVIASHYIRNLREEVRKGMRGRLKQGIYPLGAPIGYLDQGGGKPKIPDPVRAPLVREAFELYAKGRISLRSLREELYQRGLRNKAGHRVELNGLAKMLRNPFYTGIIRVKGHAYPGVHQPIVPKPVFDRVALVLDGKAATKAIQHDFLFRRMIACSHCHYHLIGERQKGRVYYRCHTKECPTTTIRQDAVEQALRSRLGSLSLTEEEVNEVLNMADELQEEWSAIRGQRLAGLRLRQDGIDSKMRRLADAYLEGSFDGPLYEEKRASLLLERQEVNEQYSEIAAGEQRLHDILRSYLEPLRSLSLSAKSENPADMRDVLRTLTSNLTADGRDLVVELRSPFDEAVSATAVSSCGLVRDRPRTRAQQFFNVFVQHYKTHGEQRAPTPP